MNKVSQCCILIHFFFEFLVISKFSKLGTCDLKHRHEMAIELSTDAKKAHVEASSGRVLREWKFVMDLI